MASRPLLDETLSEFGAAVLAGLSQVPRVIPARYFYDDAGSALFEQITALPEYYPTRTEIGLLETYAGEIAATVGPDRAVIEFGSGSSIKTPLLLRAVAPSAYVPIDISADFLKDAAAALASNFPGLAVHPLAGDFTRPLRLPPAVDARPKLGFFPGSTLGNAAPAAAVDLLRSFASTLGRDAWLLIGLDLRKDRHVLESAYDDAAGVTAAFNLNLLARINRELGGNVDTTAFRHRARWNGDAGRVEMHLEATRATALEVLGHRFAFATGETIHTENSYKWTFDEARILARAGGWVPVSGWVDAKQHFGLHLWRVASDAGEP